MEIPDGLKMLKHELKVLDELGIRPMTTVELDKQIPLHIQTLRKLLKQMETDKTIQRFGYSNGSIKYGMNQFKRRRYPRIKRYHTELKHWVFGDLTDYLPFVNKETAATRATKYLPYLCANLLMLGYQYNNRLTDLKDVGYDITDKELLKKELKPYRDSLQQLRIQLEEHIASLELVYFSLKQIQEDNSFWNLSKLGGYFDIQLDEEGIPIPPKDSHSIIEAFNIAADPSEKLFDN